MSQIKLKNLPRLKLADLLRRRKMTLQAMLAGFGITTYAGLAGHCERIGVLPPTEEQFRAAFKSPPVNSPQEGVVVVDPMPSYYVDEMTGNRIDPEAPVVPGVTVVTGEPVAAAGDTDVATSLGPPEGHQKKPRRKKEATQAE